MSKQVTIQEPELFWLLIGNVRYAMGRTSMAVPTTCDLVKRYGHALTAKQLAQIAGELREELARCDNNWAADSAPLSAAEIARHEAAIFGGGMLRKPATVRDFSGRHWLGDECDNRAWEDLAAWCESKALEVGDEP